MIAFGLEPAPVQAMRGSMSAVASEFFKRTAAGHDILALFQGDDGVFQAIAYTHGCPLGIIWLSRYDPYTGETESASYNIDPEEILYRADGLRIIAIDRRGLSEAIRHVRLSP